MTSTLLLAFALMLVLEGIMPYCAPAAWRGKPFAALSNFRMGRFASLGFDLDADPAWSF